MVLLLCVLLVYIYLSLPLLSLSLSLSLSTALPLSPQPVQAELMQALWSTLHNPYNNVAIVFWASLEGATEKMLSTPQPVCPNNEHQPITVGRVLIAWFNNCDGRPCTIL